MCLLNMCLITTAIYRNDMLELIARPYAGAICDALILMQYNAGVHTDRMSMTFDDGGVKVMYWPAMTAIHYNMSGSCFLDVFDNGHIIQ